MELLNVLPKEAPMTILLSDAGKRFNRDWIFRKLSYHFENNTAYAIVGPNGSGKSTLLQCIAGGTSMSEGQAKFVLGEKEIDTDNFYKYIAIAAPYLELIEELTVTEFLNFHSSFKPFLQGWDTKKIIDYIGLNTAANKQIRYYSSGMKQRVKLAQAIFSDVPVILLDEPCTNLDAAGYALYDRLIADFCTSRLVIVSSNDEKEFGFCAHKIDIMQYK